MNAVWQLVGILLLVGFIGAYFWWIIAILAVVAFAWMAQRAFCEIDAEEAAEARRQAAVARAGRPAAPVGATGRRQRRLWPGRRRTHAQHSLGRSPDTSGLAHPRWTVKHAAPIRQRRPIGHGTALATPSQMPPTRAGDGADQHSARPQLVSARAICRREHHPLPGR
jgi:hypothetical protein